MYTSVSEYCYVESRAEPMADGEECRVPDLPPDVGYRGFIHPWGDTWSIAEVTLPPGPEEHEPSLPPSCSPVPRDLALLLRSALVYTPALALARENIIYSGRPEPSGRDAFTALYSERLEHHLDRQHEAAYFLAKARSACYIGGLWVGQYAWIVGYRPETAEVGWITDDYFIYTNPASVFSLPPAPLERLLAVQLRHPHPTWNPGHTPPAGPRSRGGTETR